MFKPKGGRGHVAPYQTTHLRVPLPIKDEVQKIIDNYRESVLNGTEFSKEQLPSLEQAKAEAKRVLKSKQSAKKSIIKLLTSLYRVEITDADLAD